MKAQRFFIIGTEYTSSAEARRALESSFRRRIDVAFVLPFERKVHGLIDRGGPHDRATSRAR
jgi:hypothetical protein